MLNIKLNIIIQDLIRW